MPLVERYDGRQPSRGDEKGSYDKEGMFDHLAARMQGLLPRRGSVLARSAAASDSDRD